MNESSISYLITIKEFYIKNLDQLRQEPKEIKYKIDDTEDDLNPKIRNTDGGVFVCQNTQKNLK